MELWDYPTNNGIFPELSMDVQQKFRSVSAENFHKIICRHFLTFEEHCGKYMAGTFRK